MPTSASYGIPLIQPSSDKVTSVQTPISVWAHTHVRASRSSWPTTAQCADYSLPFGDVKAVGRPRKAIVSSSPFSLKQGKIYRSSSDVVGEILVSAVHFSPMPKVHLKTEWWGKWKCCGTLICYNDHRWGVTIFSFVQKEGKGGF